VLPPLRHAVSASCTSVCAFDRPARTFDFGGCSRLAAEEDRESWNKSYRQTFLSEGYKAYLQAAAQELRAVRNGPGGVQLFNLSPAWRNVEAYQLFDNSVFELPMEIWEKPSGLALCPLHIL
jgi:hypothetical protein